MMETSAPKRRKTSPTEAVPVESTTPPDPPPQQQAHQAQPAQPSPSRSPTRPSFASPTKSSLARHNPEILSRRRETVSQRAEDLPASQAASGDEDVDIDAALTAQLEHLSEGDGQISPAAVETQTGRAEAVSDAPRSPTKRVGGSILGAQPPRRTPTRPQPRPLPPPGPENEADMLDPFIGRTSHRSALNTGVLPAVLHEEPELPPTPEHPDPVVSTPPSGIHNTPSKRRRNQSEKAALQSSPTKHPLSQEIVSEQPPQKQPPQKQSQKAQGLRRGPRPVQVVAEQRPPTVQAEDTQEKPKSEFAPGTHPRRSVRLQAPNWEKRQERDALLEEIAQLEADLKVAGAENTNAAKGLPSIGEREAVLDLLRRHVLPVEKDPKPDANAAWIEAAMNPIAMLGFNGPGSLALPPAIPTENTKDEPQPPPISHHPVTMTKSEELPYLQVFTALTYSSTITTIPPSPEHPSQPTVQSHIITVRSATPPGLFSSRIEMTVNTRSLAVTSLRVSRLDGAATTELQPFINSITSAQAPYHPALTRNVGIVCWAIGEWYRVALKRAKFWHVLERQLGPDSGKARLVEIVLAMRARKKRRRKHKEQVGDGDTGVGESFESASSLGDLDSMLLSKAELLPHMGRTSMDLEIPYLTGEGEVSELRINWSVQFDWTGEARSKLGVDVVVPGKWQAIDERDSIVGIPKLFDRLVQGGEDPLTAVKTVVALLAGEPAA